MTTSRARAERVAAPERDDTNGFPIQTAKVQRPPLRDDILARDRLLDWLHVKIHHKLVLVLAEAGYGKTTLLADFAGRTRLRTLWYRLDEDDRDWVTLLHHLVAAGREHDPAFAPRTGAMLADSGVSGPSRDTVLDTFLRELTTIAEHGAVLILDDLHLVDDAPDVRVVVRELIARTPERMTVVIASRRAPSVSIAKLRAGGEVAELRTDDLRFDATETARLFSESYGRPLDADVLVELSARTEGWAASLQLVQAALRDRSPAEIRRFVRNLTGADQDLYDYLAEEVVGELPEELQQFLMRTSLLQIVRPDLAEAVTGLPTAQVRALTSTAERFSLLSRRGSTHRDHLRYHPLVRDFLEARLERWVADHDEVVTLHRTVAEATETTDWRVACHHYASIGDDAGIVRTIDAAVEEIVARGDVLLAESYVLRLSSEGTATSREVVRSRADFKRGNTGEALQRAIEARKRDPASPVALANLASIAHRSGELDLALDAATNLAALRGESSLKAIGAGLVAMIESSLEGDLRIAVSQFERLRQLQAARGHSHHEGTTVLNIALFQKAQGNARAVEVATTTALALLSDDPLGAEFVSALAAKGWSTAHLGDLATARKMFERAMASADGSIRSEALVEAAETETWYGASERAADLLDRALPLAANPAVFSMAASTTAQLALRRHDLSQAAACVDRFRTGKPDWVPANKTQQRAIQAHLAVAMARPDAPVVAGQALADAERQGADFWAHQMRLLLAIMGDTEGLNRHIRTLAAENRVYLTILAERVAEKLSVLTGEAADVVAAEVRVRPERWRDPLRLAVDLRTPSALVAAGILDEIGTTDDIPRLRRFSRASGGAASTVGKGLARRLAAPVFVEDQGRVGIRIGDRHVEGTSIRRKVLTLLCFLLTKPRFSATRDEVLEALWPDFEPAIALNSLNQTVYFLRRVIEPAYLEDTSPGYVRHESDVVWLDRQLISSRSQRCADAIRGLSVRPTPGDVDHIANMYQGRFALDFAYEEWAVNFRDTLHASYLQIIESALNADLGSGHFDRGVALARRAVAVDPDAEQLELSLLRLLRATGAHAAAAEQYSHYAASLRENLGVEAPPLESL